MAGTTSCGTWSSSTKRCSNNFTETHTAFGGPSHLDLSINYYVNKDIINRDWALYPSQRLDILVQSHFNRPPTDPTSNSLTFRFVVLPIDVLFPLVGWLKERFETTPNYNRQMMMPMVYQSPAQTYSDQKDIIIPSFFHIILSIFTERSLWSSHDFHQTAPLFSPKWWFNGHLCLIFFHDLPIIFPYFHDFTMICTFDFQSCLLFKLRDDPHDYHDSVSMRRRTSDGRAHRSSAVKSPQRLGHGAWESNGWKTLKSTTGTACICMCIWYIYIYIYMYKYA